MKRNLIRRLTDNKWWLIGQAMAILAVIGCVVMLVLAIHRGLRAHGIPFGFDFLLQKAGFQISEGRTLTMSHGWPSLVDFSANDTNWQAFATGLFNTIKASVIAIIISTLIGLLLGAARISTNWLARQVALAVVELIRNTPLLVQLFFWYFAVVLKLPPIVHATTLYGTMIASRQGIYLPALLVTTQWTNFSWFLYAGLLLAGCGLVILKNKYRRWVSLLLLLLSCSIGWAFSGRPISVQFPVAGHFNAKGGLGISPEFCAILIALVVYTAAFIAEIVRGAIQSIHKGQWEAAFSIGLTRAQALKNIIIPQAYRIIVPPLGNQYLSLAKNTSLAIAIGFPDLFNVYGTIANQTGRSLEGIIIVMMAYLALNWTISGLVNIYNRHIVSVGAK